MTTILKSPGKYVQGPGVLATMDLHLEGCGKDLLVLISPSGQGRIGPVLDACFAGKDIRLHQCVFTGECCEETIGTLCAQAQGVNASCVVGIGGGKILDTAKAVSFYTGLPGVIVPTVASTDAPCSSLSVLYHPDGTFARYLYLPTCPQVVLVDTAIIAKAPVGLLVAGMGDALATHFEARACRRAGCDNQLQAKPTLAATALAAQCWTLLQDQGVPAKEAVAQGLCNGAVDTIVEVNTYLSSVGFESGGLAAAHAIQKGFTHVPALHSLYHGNKVAFCTIVQLVLEQAPPQELEAVLSFCVSVGLPICFAHMGYFQVDEAALRKVSQVACAPGSTLHHMPFAVTEEMVYQGLMQADKVGAAFCQRPSV